ncbi:MAG: IreB family regulatory phosphoprotein [Tissierellia bacterium]|nr:IreB family regulatory phosphoprotein [Tissierellia bacterium]
MGRDFNETMKFEPTKDGVSETQKIIFTVYEALKERGYDPIDQIIGYMLSGDPTYITSYNDARSVIRKIERDEFLEEILNYYLEGQVKGEKGI